MRIGVGRWSWVPQRRQWWRQRQASLAGGRVRPGGTSFSFQPTTPYHTLPCPARSGALLSPLRRASTVPWACCARSSPRWPSGCSATRSWPRRRSSSRATRSAQCLPQCGVCTCGCPPSFLTSFSHYSSPSWLPSDLLEHAVCAGPGHAVAVAGLPLLPEVGNRIDIRLVLLHDDTASSPISCRHPRPCRSFVNFSALSIGSAMCMGRFDYVDQMLFETLVPVAMVAILKGVSMVHLAFFAPDDAALRAKVTIHAWAALHAAGGNTQRSPPSRPPYLCVRSSGRTSPSPSSSRTWSCPTSPPR